VEDVIELVQRAKPLQKDPLKRTGILIYRNPPDAVVRLRIAEVHMHDHFVVIPISLAAVERAEQDRAGIGVLNSYAAPYLPGADLFDDRLAISDTFTFFGRARLLARLEEDLCRLQGVGLFGLRKAGKTSVLLQLGFLLRNHPVVHCDLELYGANTRYGGELFNFMLERLTAHRTHRLPHFPSFGPDLPATQLTTEFARRVTLLAKALQRVGYSLPILCFLDEMERILPTKTDPRERVEEFNACLGVLRALSQEQRILALLVADVHPDCNRINYWMQEDVASNPVYNFFKEVFLPPFSQQETTDMITDLGRFMGRTFDAQTLQAIYRESGGHPYVARQLASLVYARVPTASITWSDAQPYVERSFLYYGVLRNYCIESIWGDLQKRNFTSAMAILQILACNGVSNRWITADTLRSQLRSEYGYLENQWLDALLWLESVGLVTREMAINDERYQLRVSLLTHWLRMQTQAEETRQWQDR
jgi:hypothetical protein